MKLKMKYMRSELFYHESCEDESHEIVIHELYENESKDNELCQSES